MGRMNSIFNPNADALDCMQKKLNEVSCMCEQLVDVVAEVKDYCKENASKQEKLYRMLYEKFLISPDFEQQNMTVREIASILKKTEKTVREYIRKGVFEGAFKKEGCKDWLVPTISVKNYLEDKGLCTTQMISSNE